MFSHVEIFHRKFFPFGNANKFTRDEERKTLFLDRIDSKMKKLKGGLINDDEFTIFSACLHLVYLLMGVAFTTGVREAQWNAGWRLVHRSNLTKRRAETRKDSKYNTVYDVVKPTGFEPIEPSLGAILEAETDEEIATLRNQFREGSETDEDTPIADPQLDTSQAPDLYTPHTDHFDNVRDPELDPTEEEAAKYLDSLDATIKRKDGPTVHDLVYVVWEDSTQPLPSWEFMSDLPELHAIECSSVGWVVESTDTHLVLAPNIGGSVAEGNLQGCGFITIPQSAIRSLTPLNSQISDTL